MNDLHTLSQICTPAPAQSRAPFLTGLPQIDAALPGGGLRSGALHELVATTSESPPLSPLPHLPPATKPPSTPTRCVPQRFPLRLAIALSCNPQDPTRPVAWVGTNTWPYPGSLPHWAASLAHTLIDAPTAAVRTWAAELTLRAGIITIIDCQSLDLRATRKLQLAAERSGTVGFLLRPSDEPITPTAAHTRWAFAPAPPPPGTAIARTYSRRWALRLLRCKSLPIDHDQPAHTWILEEVHATGLVTVVPHAQHRPHHTHSLTRTA